MIERRRLQHQLAKAKRSEGGITLRILAFQSNAGLDFVKTMTRSPAIYDVLLGCMSTDRSRWLFEYATSR